MAVRLVIICKRSKSEVDVCTGAEPLYLERLCFGRKETLVGYFEAGWTVKNKFSLLVVALRWAALMLGPRGCHVPPFEVIHSCLVSRFTALKSSKRGQCCCCFSCC